MIQHDSRMRKGRKRVTVIAAFALAWAIIQPFLGLTQTGFAIMAFGNGLAVALYAAAMYLIQGGASGRLRAGLVIPVALTHYLWVFPLADLLSSLLPPPISSEFHAMLGTTGIVLGGLVCILSPRLMSILPIVAGTAAALVCVSIPVGTADPIILFGCGITCLHLGLLTAVVSDTLRQLSRGSCSAGCSVAGAG